MGEKIKNISKSKNKISLVSLGCPKNLVDSNTLTRKLIGTGFSYLNEPKDADILLINTCGFIEDAKRESIEEILKLAKLKNSLMSQRFKNLKKLIVFGCLAKRYRDDLIREIPEIDAIFGVGEEEKIVDYCKKVKGSEDISRLAPCCLPLAASFAYLKIADGCNKNCSYCVIPAIRGNYKSTAHDAILKESEQLIKAGVKELILVAQDTACYRDTNGYDISSLLKDIASINGDFWIRLLYVYPSSITASLLKVIAEEDKICKYLDIPLQHSEDRILRLMGRKGTRKEYLKLIKKIRHDIPDIALRTTFIVGFPSETKDEFDSLIDFIEKARFDRLGAFKYSKEEGTPASKLKGQIAGAIKNKRVEKLMQHQASISLEKNKELIGRKFRAIVDEINEGTATARLYSHAPEIDGVVVIEQSSVSNHQLPPHTPLGKEGQKGGNYSKIQTSNSFKTGDFVNIKITDAFEYDLKGNVVK